MKNFIVALICLSVPLLMGAGSDSNSSSSSSSSSSSGHERHYKKGVKAQDSGKYEEAVKHYKRALKENPEHADSLNNMGFSLRMIGKRYMDEAAQAYEKALSADAKHEGALEYQGELYLWWGKLDLANKNLKKLQKMNSKEAKTLQQKLDLIVAQAKKL